ncbi:unnamed protein product [Boreogadus saida]
MLNITETESSSSESVSDEDKEYAPQTSEESDGSSDEEPLKVPTITEELDDEEESLNEESIEASGSSSSESYDKARRLCLTKTNQFSRKEA